MFDMLNADGGWLDSPDPAWEMHPEYELMRNFHTDLKVVNNAAERCIKDIQKYRGSARDSIHREKVLLVVNDHRDVFQDLRRQALSNMSI